jgi:hypothetical protein
MIRTCLAIGVSLVLSSSLALGAEPFDGKTFEGWTCKGNKTAEEGKWAIGRAKVDPDNARQLVVEPTDANGDLVRAGGKGIDIYTKAEFGDGTYEVEVMVPQGSNSGIYLMGEYEVQVLDSYGREKLSPGDMGGIYGATAPRVNASKKPGEWQKFVIEFRAPKFDATGNKTQNARFVKITLNGEVIHENVEMEKQTPGGVKGKEAPAGPLMFQGDHGAVAYRNIKITPAK